MAEVQVQYLADLGVKPLHVLDAVVGEVQGAEVRQPRQVGHLQPIRSENWVTRLDAVF